MPIISIEGDPRSLHPIGTIPVVEVSPVPQVDPFTRRALIIRETGRRIDIPDPKRFLLLSPQENKAVNLVAKMYPEWSLERIGVELEFERERQIHQVTSIAAKKLGIRGIDQTAYYVRQTDALAPQQQIAEMNFGEALKYFWARAGMNQTEFIELSGVSKMTLNRIKKGPHTIGQSGTIRELIKGFGWENDDPRVVAWMAKLPFPIKL